jgi:hypothetical protein
VVDVHVCAAGAPPAKHGGMFGGRGGREGAVAAGRDDGFALNAGARIGLAITQLLTAIVRVLCHRACFDIHNQRRAASAAPLCMTPAQQWAG